MSIFGKPGWELLRLRVLERDQYCCQVCSSKDGLVVHHKIPRKLGGNDSLDNLITLCRICHIPTERTIQTWKPSRKMTTREIESEASPYGNKAHITVPKTWIGSKVRVIKIALIVLVVAAIPLVGTAAAVFLEGTPGPDVMVGTDEDDTFYGKDGNDEIIGLGGDDVLGGDNGDDFISGSVGNDIQYGGNGNDRLEHSGDSAVTTMIGDAGNDKLVWGGNSAPSGGQIFMYGGAGNDNVTVAVQSGNRAYAIMTGDDGNDRLITYTKSAMYGGAGEDLLDASSANDPVIAVGDSGHDIIKGSPHADWIWGGEGNDNLTGGLGADYFNCGPGQDTIVDFTPGQGDVKTGDCE